ncbi:hypothetical protein K438DRAFT_1993357 [Mycena galopus ATCC 62051]|nr:hypothetical protein K438DRAFT_1993357 [Mycena galopus ATCC 62051]
MLARLRPRLPRCPTRALHASASARLASYTPYDPTSKPHEAETVDGCIVGRPSAAIRLEQLELETRNEMRVVVLGCGHQALCPGCTPPRLAYGKYAISAHEQQQNHIASLSRGHRRRNGRFIPGFAGARRLLSQEANAQDAQGRKVHSVRGVVTHNAGLARTKRPRFKPGVGFRAGHPSR